jgi:predicted ArsR family transcriptional regulator
MSKKAMGRVLNRYEIDQRIVEVIAMSPHSTIDEIAKETGLSYTAVRNSLQRLMSLSVVDESYEAEEPARRGRPATYFQIDKGLRIVIPPRQFQHLALTIIEQLIQEEGTLHVAALLDRAAKIQVKHMITSWEEEKTFPKNLAQMLDRICDYINEQGCFAKHLTSKKGHHIQVRNCVYDKIASAYPGTICRYHESLITNLVLSFDDSLSVIHEEAMAEGAEHCRYVIISV